MANEECLSESDVRAMMAVLGHIAGLDEDLATRRRVLLENLAQLIGADCWHWCLLGRKTSGELPTFSVFLKGGFTEERFAKYLTAQEHPEMAMFNAPILAELENRGSHITRLRQQVDSENRFPKSDVYRLWREADLAPLILSMRPGINGQVSAVTLFRNFDRPLFNGRENRIAHVMLSSVPWLHEEAWPNHPRRRVGVLSPRLHTVINLLLQGMGRKQIATEMGISIHTLNDYIKDIYLRFDVHSQSELIRLFVEGDGGDRAVANGAGI
jgi:DNA-binding CsgD family transcriptional regulator